MKIYSSKTAFAILLLFVMMLSGCLSYSIKGLAENNRLPDKTLIGTSYKSVVDQYGIPNRIFHLNQNRDMDININNSMRNNPIFSNFDSKELGEKDFIANYKLVKNYTIFLYSRQRDYDYTITIKDDKVVSVNSFLTSKKDSVGFSISDIFAGSLAGDMIPQK